LHRSWIMKNEKMIHFLGRALLSGIFIGAGISKVRGREQTLDYMASKKMPRSSMLLNGAIAMELGVAPAVALGVLPRFTAPMLASFLVPTAFIFHDFWKVEKSERQMEQINFMKDLAIAGGLIVVALHDIEKSRMNKMKSAEPYGLETERPNYLAA
jgi:putative oxidoreductase